MRDGGALRPGRCGLGRARARPRGGALTWCCAAEGTGGDYVVKASETTWIVRGHAPPHSCNVLWEHAPGGGRRWAWSPPAVQDGGNPDISNHTRYINHAPDPEANCAMFCDDESSTMMLFTLRPVRHGVSNPAPLPPACIGPASWQVVANAQLFWDYGPTYWEGRQRPLAPLEADWVDDSNELEELD